MKFRRNKLNFKIQMESVVQRDSAVYTYFSDTLLIDGTSTIAAICRSTLFPNSEFYNRDKSSIFSRKKNALRPRRNEKHIYIRACIRTSITLRVKTAQLHGCTSVSSGSLHACMMNSLRRLLLSEVTGHKVMTATVLRIPQFYSTLFAQFSHASISRSHSCPTLPCHRLQLHLQLPLIAIYEKLLGYFTVSFLSVFAFHQQCFIRNCALLILLFQH